MTHNASIRAAVAASFLLMASAPTIAVEFCGSRTDMVKSLAERFKENPTAIGMINGHAVLEIFVSKDGTWTILATGTDGRSCVLSAGVGWEISTVAMDQGV